MKVKVNTLKFKKQLKSSEYDLIVYYLKNDYERFKGKSWYDMCLHFKDVDLISRVFGTNMHTYGLIFNTTLLTFNNALKQEFEVYKIGKNYFLKTENILDFEIFKKVDKKMIENKPYRVFKSREWV